MYTYKSPAILLPQPFSNLVQTNCKNVINYIIAYEAAQCFPPAVMLKFNLQ